MYIYLVNFNYCNNVYPILFNFGDIDPFYDSCTGLNEIPPKKVKRNCFKFLFRGTVCQINLTFFFFIFNIFDKFNFIFYL